MTVPKKLVINMVVLLGVLLFLLSVVGTAVGYILLFDPQEFNRSPQMAVIFTIGLAVLITTMVSFFMILRHQVQGIKLFTASAILAILLSWLVMIVIAVIYNGEDVLGLVLSVTILFLPLYIQVYLINYDDDVIQWIQPSKGASVN